MKKGNRARQVTSILSPSQVTSRDRPYQRNSASNMSDPSAGNSHIAARRSGRQHDTDWADFVRSRNLLNRPLSPSPSTVSSGRSEFLAEMEEVFRTHNPRCTDTCPILKAFGATGGVPWNESDYIKPLTTPTGPAALALQVGNDDYYDMMNLEQRSEPPSAIYEEQRPVQPQHNTALAYPAIPRLHLSSSKKQHLQQTKGSPPSLSRARRRTQIPTISHPTRATMHRITRQSCERMRRKPQFWELDNRGAPRRFLYRRREEHS
ncbi:hypothetical protein F4680DRAFT_259228 [Xylaria scruposa]|nr:hypothetical protein F4680DRAFT_259228 [Xylaria scruposa]